MTKPEKLVVTRHEALVKYLIQEGHVGEDTPHLTHATIDDVTGKHVYGILPNWLACHTAKMTEIQLRLPPHKRGDELTLKEIKFHANVPQTYIIKLTKEEDDDDE